MNNIALFLRSIGEHGMAEEVESEHNRLEAFADGLDKDCLNAQFKAGAASRDAEVAELNAALQAVSDDWDGEHFHHGGDSFMPAVNKALGREQL